MEAAGDANLRSSEAVWEGVEELEKISRSGRRSWEGFWTQRSVCETRGDQIDPDAGTRLSTPPLNNELEVCIL